MISILVDIDFIRSLIKWFFCYMIRFDENTRLCICLARTALLILIMDLRVGLMRILWYYLRLAISNVTTYMYKRKISRGWLVPGEWVAVRVDLAVGSIHSLRRNLASSFAFVPLRRACLRSCQPQGSTMFCILRVPGKSPERPRSRYRRRQIFPIDPVKSPNERYIGFRRSNSERSRISIHALSTYREAFAKNAFTILRQRSPKMIDRHFIVIYRLSASLPRFTPVCSQFRL